ncbi:unnamed protein product [Paramecium sonneborni]|uniref:Uncharacterized protein n=1 Tax=Paramecium sonneborni TaxID=65129 RepID=A0A8S1LCR6_9CILI|nr:unnamed protein product [Paramecium sonneborni]
MYQHSAQYQDFLYQPQLQQKNEPQKNKYDIDQSNTKTIQNQNYQYQELPNVMNKQNQQPFGQFEPMNFNQNQQFSLQNISYRNTRDQQIEDLKYCAQIAIQRRKERMWQKYIQPNQNNNEEYFK